MCMGSQSEEVLLVQKSMEIKYHYKLQCHSVFSRVFLMPSSWWVFHIIQLFLVHLDPILVDHLSYYLSTCSIRYLLQLSVSCDSQDSTVQRSSPHKCSQKSSCNAFNAVVVVFSQIFWVSFPLVCLCKTLLSIELPGGLFQWLKYTLELRWLGPRRDSPSDRPPFVPSLWDFKLEFLITIRLSLDHPNVLGQSPRPNA